MKQCLSMLLVMALAGVTRAGASSDAGTDARKGIEANSWEISIAAGYGVVETPVALETDLEFHVLPSVVWYGERAYFDNGLFGYALSETATQQWDLVLYPNEDGLLFNLTGGSAGLVLNNPFEPDAPPVVIDEIERRVSAMAGLRYNRIGEQLRAYVELAGDISGVHNGWELGSEIGLAQPVELGPVLLNAFVGIRFKDTNLVDYYYTPELGEITPLEGELRPDGDQMVPIGPYNGEEGWLAHLQIDLWWPLAERWALRATLRQNRYSDSIADSLLLTRQQFPAGFLGLEYRF